MDGWLENIFQIIKDGYFSIFANILTVITCFASCVTLVTVDKYKSRLLNEGTKKRIIKILNDKLVQVRRSVQNETPISKEYLHGIQDDLMNIKPYSTSLRFGFGTRRHRQIYNEIKKMNHGDLNLVVLKSKLEIIIGVFKDEQV